MPALAQNKRHKRLNRTNILQTFPNILKYSKPSAFTDCCPPHNSKT
ncbi:hypothetical protein BACSTE_00280 [Bacteroides stercoris ATCC 43183]|uniref:Uncharacterized protein n=1 Tax=Bacteroides stercoris ATCC 43183 TaxID=449673 RepID=B0NLJ6_BACSE|nr:hypothetical protein BACSTE_00280 [Bacteroides stercoris ATCC 43183]